MTSLALLAALTLAVASGQHIVRPRTGEPMTDTNGDVAQLPQRYPEAAWLPIDSRGLRIRAELELNGVRVPVILDTGAAVTMVDPKTAHLIGLDGPLVTREPTKALDANRHTVEGYLAGIDAVILGSVRVRGVRALVLPTLDATLIGYDVLAHVDMLFALDEGLVGIFPPGKGPTLPRALTTKIATLAAPTVHALFDDAGREMAAFIVDTGAPFTSLQDTEGDAFQLPVDTSYGTTVGGVAGKTRKANGAYRIDDLQLGRERVSLGPVLATRAEMSLLGNDVLLRHRTLLSSDNATLTFAGMPIRPAVRTTGPDGKPCPNGPCVATRVEGEGADRCLLVAIDPVWAGRTVEGVVDLLDDAGANVAAGQGTFAFELTVPAEGARRCLPIERALDPRRPPPATLSTSLLRFHTRGEKRCPRELCLSFTGPVRAIPAAAPPAPAATQR